MTVTHDRVVLNVSFWEQAYVYGVIVPTFTGSLLSSQVISGSDQNNTALSPQFASSLLTD